MSLEQLLTEAQSGIPLSQRPWTNLEVASISTSSIVAADVKIGNTTLESSAPSAQTVTFGSKSTGAGDVVYTSGPQTIGGQKTFTLPVDAQSFVDRSDSGNPLRFRQESASAAFNASLEIDYAGNLTQTLGPNTSATIVYSTPTAQLAITDTTNTTNLTFPTPTGTVALTFPSTTDTILGAATTNNVSGKTFTDSLKDSKTSDQIVLGLSGSATTISAPASTADQKVLIQDSGVASASIILSDSKAGTQTINTPVELTVGSNEGLTIVSQVDNAVVSVVAKSGGGGSYVQFADENTIYHNITGVGTTFLIAWPGLGRHAAFVIPTNAADDVIYANEAQSLTNKTLAAPEYTGQVASSLLTWDPTGAGASTVDSATGYVDVKTATNPLGISAVSGVITVTNSFSTTASIITPSIYMNSDTSKNFWPFVSTVANGSFTLYLQNGLIAIPTGTTFRIGFTVQ